MGKILGKGTPHKHLEGAIGDIYVNEVNGKEYICDYAYGINGDFEYVWKETGMFYEQDKLEELKTTKVEEVVIPEEKIDEIEPEVIDEEEPTKVNYTKFSDKKKN